MSLRLPLRFVERQHPAPRRAPEFHRLTLVDTLLRRFPRTAARTSAPGLPVLARWYIVTESPRVAELAAFGGAFPDFLAEQPELAERPWLAELARLEWAMHRLRLADDERELSASRILAIPVASLTSMVLKIRPTFLPFASRWPVAALFDDEASMSPEPVRIAPVHLLLRRDPECGLVRTMLDRPRFVFLRELAAGSTVGLAARTAAACDDGFDLAAAFGQLVAMGAFAAPDEGNGWSDDGESP